MKTRNLFLSAVTSLLVIWSSQLSASAQLTLTGTNYTEGFESIAGGSLPTGWTCRFNIHNAPPVGPVGDEIPYTDGTPRPWNYDIGLPWNMASVNNIDPATSNLFVDTTDAATQGAATNRVAGQRLASSTDGETSWTLQIEDTLGLANFEVSMDLLVLTTNARAAVWTVEYAVGDVPTAFTSLTNMSPESIDSHFWGVTNSGPVAIPADADNQGQNLWIRLAQLTDSLPSSGARDTYGIDNFVLNYTGGVVNTNSPSVTTQPQSITNNAGETAVFTVEADGAPVLVYQWRKDGFDLGAPNLASLTLPEVVTADGGNYDVIITNAYGAATSTVATLTVVADPGLAGSFASLTNMPGDAIRITIDVAGTLPKSVQWYKDGVAIPGASDVLSNDVNNTVGYTLTTNATAADAGTYSLVVSNTLGVVTGLVADVTVLTAPSTRIASWNFNSLVEDGDSGTGNYDPSTGSGFLQWLFTTPAFDPGGPADPADYALTNDNSGLFLDDWASQGADNKVFGCEYEVSTVGYQDILVSWNEYHNTRASRYMRFQYSTNGVDFVDANVFNFIELGGDGTYFLLTNPLYGIAGVEDNADFRFRIVSEWESTATGSGSDQYLGTGGSYSPSAGRYRYDLVTVWGNPLGTEVPIAITGLDVSGGSNVVTFSSGPWDAPGEFELLNTSNAGGTYTSVVGAAISATSPGDFEADTAAGGSEEYYGIGR